MHGQQNVKKKQSKRNWCVLEDTFLEQRVTQIRLHHEARDMRNVWGGVISDMNRRKSGN